MKKIFAISFLSVFAVVGVARAEYVGYYASGTDVNQNYNLASVNFVKGRYDEAVEKAKELVITSDKKTTVAGDRYFYEQTGSDEKAPTIKYMENSIAEAVADIDLSTKVDKTSVISSTGTVTSDDTQIPTIKRMESEIEDALGWVEDTVVAIDQGVEKKEQILVTDSVGAVITVPQIGMDQVGDLEGVLNSKIGDDRILSDTTVTAGGVTGSLASYTVGIQASHMDHENEVLASSIPTVEVVTETFVPNQAHEVNDDYHTYTTNGSGDIRPGLYAIMVNVTEGGQKEYIWQAVQYNTEVTSTGGTQSPL